MTDKLPPPLLALFQPRPPVRYVPPQDPAPEARGAITSHLSGLGSFLSSLADYKATDTYEPTTSWLQRRDAERVTKREREEAMQKEGFDGFKPDQDPKIKGDPTRTLFVGRLAFDAKEADLEKEFGRFGPVERIRIVRDEVGDSKRKARGYAFVVFEREKDMKVAYKETDGLRIKDRRIVVDVERGRLVEGWKPRRFGGGLGGRGATKASLPPVSKYGPPGGFQGGSRGGFGESRGGFSDRGSRGGFRGGFRDREPRGGGYGDRGGDRGGYNSRGVGFRGGSNFGDRNGYTNGNSSIPAGTPSGPGGSSRGHYDDRRNRDPRDRDQRDPRDSRGGGGYRDHRYDDRDRDRNGEDGYNPRKRFHEGDGYDDSRSKRRY